MGKQEALKSLQHQSTSKVPMDFGSTAVTGIHVSCVAELRHHFGLEEKPVKVHEPYQMLGLVEEDLQEAMGLDTVGIFAPKTMFGFPITGWKAFPTPWGQEVLVPEDFRTTTGENGGILIYPEGDTNAPPSGVMPASGYFFDSIIRQEPIVEDELNPEDNLEEFGPLSEEDLDHYRRAVETLPQDRLAVATLPGLALGDIALVPAPFLKHPKGIRDVAEWYLSTATRQDYLHQIFEKQTEIALENLARFQKVVGDKIDVLFICGTDFGSQNSQFCSTQTFDALYRPYYRRINDWIHQNTSWKTFKHSCGAVEPFLSHFIEAGFDIINPVQCSATGMDPATLKDRYGKDLVFWGGGVDTQKTLPFSTPEAVRDEVLQRCEIFAPAGGFMFNAIHNIQARTPVENIVAMLEAVQDFNG